MRNFFYRLTHWEKWDYRVKYYLLSPWWLLYCLRARSLWWFTASNPSLTFGGFEGETKMEMYADLPPGSFPKTIRIDPSMNAEEAMQKVLHKGFDFPFVVKPDAGMMGFMFRKVSSPGQFENYHGEIGCPYLVQEMINYPLEISVFYYRFPGNNRGTITGFLRKESMQVTGDGYSKLLELMKRDSMAKFRLKELRSKHSGMLDTVLPAGQTYILSFARNLSRGGKLVSMSHEIDEKLLAVFDRISLYKNCFFYGRYDILCTTIEDLKEGRNYSILEFNGAGAEPHHVYGMGNNLFQAQRILLKHWSILFKISVMNRRRGIAFWPYSKGRSFLSQAKNHFSRLRKLDREFPVYP